MISTPLAKHAELANELFRWYRTLEAGYTVSDAATAASAIIVELELNAPSTDRIITHPLVDWISYTFTCSWSQASVGLAAHP